MRILDPDKGVGNFGRWLAYNIFCSGLSIGEFAETVGVCYKTVHNHMYKLARPSIAIIHLYCDFFQEKDFWRVYDTVLMDWEA